MPRDKTLNLIDTEDGGDVLTYKADRELEKLK